MGKDILQKIKNFFGGAKKQASRPVKKVGQFVDRFPFASFFVALGILLLLIVISNVLGTPKIKEKPVQKQVKPVHIYRIGSAPKVKVQAQIEKSGVLHITALTAGVVQKANKREGDSFKRGETLISMSTNYQGGNTSSLQRSLAQKTYNNAVDSYDLQKGIIQKQRDIADKTDANNDQLRNITQQSIDETNNLINVNGDILTTLDQRINNLSSNNPGGINDDKILSFKEMKSQFLAANNQAKQALRSAQYQSSPDNPPAQLSDLTKDLVFKQLDLQQKMLDLNKEIAHIQLNIAQVVEAMMFPSAPFNGVVQQVLVKEGEAVSPGEELLIIAQNVKDDPTLAIAYVPREVAEKISQIEPSILHVNKDESLLLQPSYITQDAVRGTLHAVYFTIPNDYIPKVTETGFLDVEIPIGYFDTPSSIPYVPIDAVYQTKENNYVFIIKDKKAVSQKVQLGDVFGGYVEVQGGLSQGSEVITDRNVIVGDSIQIVN